MALVRDIIFKARPSLSKLIKDEITTLNLKAVNKVTIKFDPFRDDVKYIREFSHLMHTKSARKSNPKCLIKTEILTNRSEHTVTFNLSDGKKFVFECANFTTIEILLLMNEHLTPLVPKEEAPAATLKKLQRKKF